MKMIRLFIIISGVAMVVNNFQVIIADIYNNCP